MRTSNKSRGFPTTSNKKDHRATSVFRAQPTTTCNASSKWSKNSTTRGSTPASGSGKIAGKPFFVGVFGREDGRASASSSRTA